jgi:hypothetical protein
MYNDEFLFPLSCCSYSETLIKTIHIQIQRHFGICYPVKEGPLTTSNQLLSVTLRLR